MKAHAPPVENRAVRVLIVAGGTGGHVYPALAVAEKLLAMGGQVSWLGTRAGLEGRVVPQAGLDIRFVRVSGVRGRGLLPWLLAPLRLAVAIAQSLGIILGVSPHVVLGMGGFVAGPGGVAAWLSRRPLLIHEQNAVPGLTNRALSRIATRVMEAFPGSFPPGRRAQHTGNPVRRRIAELALPTERFAGRSGPLRVLVLGGSQGARALNDVFPSAVKLLEDPASVAIRHQAGERDLGRTQARYSDSRSRVQVVPYIEDMAEAYGWADLVVCRAGAMTVAELAAVGLASILVPFPHAVDDHQTANARFLVDAGAALLVPQADLSATSVGRLLGELRAAPKRLLAMAMAARRLAVPDAAARVAHVCTEVARA